MDHNDAHSLSEMSVAAERQVARDLEKVRSAEVCTGETLGALSDLLETARKQPELILPYTNEIAALLDSASDRVRASSIETLALLSRVSPQAMAFVLPKLHAVLSSDPAELVGDHAIEILSNYAKTSRHAAERVLPIIASTIDKYATKNVMRALTLLADLGREVPKLGKEIVKIGDRFQKSVVDGVRKAAQNLRSLH